MLWVIQENIGNEGKFVSLIDNIEKFGQRITLVKVVPFVGEIIPDIDTDDSVICFGTYSMRKLAERKRWTPGVYDIEWFPYQRLIDALGDSVLNHDATFGNFGDILPTEDEFFIRPTHDGKEFAGKLMSSNQLKEWQHRIINLKLQDNGTMLSEHTEVMCANIKKIYNEFRFFVVGGKAVTGSQYKLGKRVVYSNADDMLYIAQEFVDRLIPDINQPYVLDLALTDDGYKVIELNTLNCSGFYACDMQKLVSTLIAYEENK